MDDLYSNLARKKNLPFAAADARPPQSDCDPLGYDGWADYAIEVNMAKTSATAISFLNG